MKFAAAFIIALVMGTGTVATAYAADMQVKPLKDLTLADEKPAPDVGQPESEGGDDDC